MFDFSKIDSFQVETSTYCNVACPLCPRHFMGTSIVRPTLRQRNILAPQWDKFLDDMDHIATKEHPVNMVFCGCHGDPPMTPDWEEIIINTANRNYVIDVETNGSMRTPKSWARVGKAMGDAEKEQGIDKIITFSIDGLSDTNKLYRIGIKHERVMANAKAFIDAGGKARWKFIVFEHNKHQVEEAQQLAKDMGFWQFDKHVSTRNFEYNYAEVEKKNNEIKPSAITVETDIKKVAKNRKDVKGDEISKIQYVGGTSYQQDIEITETTKELNITDAGAKIYKDIIESSDMTQITCDFKENKMMYIDSEMNLWPCNHIAATKQEDMTHYYKLEKEYGIGWNNLEQHTAEDIFYHEYFQNILPLTWKDPSHELCTFECRKMCGGGLHSKAWDAATNREEL